MVARQAPLSLKSENISREIQGNDARQAHMCPRTRRPDAFKLEVVQNAPFHSRKKSRLGLLSVSCLVSGTALYIYMNYVVYQEV